MKRYILLLFFLTALSSATTAQLIYDFGKLITGNVNDSKYLAEGYMVPAMKAFGYGMNNGWYNSAGPHKLGGFDITLTTSLAFAPAGDKSYLVDNAKMTQIERVNSSGVPENGGAPTVFGAQGNSNEPNYRTPKGTLGVPFQGPAGSGLTNIPTPALGLGIGLPLGFELRLRYVPTVDLNKVPLLDDYHGSFGLFGVGVMHDIKQWIPGIKELPLDISAFVGYTKMALDVGISTTDPNKKSELTCSATTIQALVGKKISILAVYGSVGYNICKTELAIKGNYDFNGTIVKDPFKMSADSNGLRATLGMRIRLAVLSFHGDYSFQKYRTATAGFGINFR